MIRFVAGLLFWLNALGLYHPSFSPALADIASRIGVEFVSVSIILTLLLLSLLSLYGLKNTLVSAFYIYAFPFILAWKTSKLLFQALRWLHRGVRTALPTPEDPTAFADILPIWRSINPNMAASTSGIPKTKVESTKSVNASEDSEQKTTTLERILDIFSIVLGRSTLLCGFLIVVSSVKSVVMFGLIASCFGLIRFNIIFVINTLGIRKIADYVHGNFMRWFDSAEKNARENLGKTPSTQNPIGTLLFWKFLLNVITKAREVPEMLTVGILVLFTGSLLWISTVFYFIYLGFAKLTLPRTDWPTWYDSFFFPILGRNIAHTSVLTAIVVLHYFEIVMLLYALWTFITAEIGRLRKGLRTYEAIVDQRITNLQEEYSKFSIVLIVPESKGESIQQPSGIERPKKRGKSSKQPPDIKRS